MGKAITEHQEERVTRRRREKGEIRDFFNKLKGEGGKRKKGVKKF